MKILLDMSSVLWMSLLAGEDKENGRKMPNPIEGRAPVQINSAAFGFENLVNHVVAVLKKFGSAPRDIIMVFDGKNSKALRQSIDPLYKANRDHHPDSYVEFDKLRTMATETLRGLGALSVEQEALEADDILCYLSKNLRMEHVICTNDGDMLVLMGGKTSVYRNGDLNENKYGPFDPKFITLYKALVGDTSDGFKGAKGFGPKTFIDLLCTFGESGLDMLQDLVTTKCLDALIEDVAEFKPLQKIIDDKESVYNSWALARMYPERVNIARRPLQITAGMCEEWDSKRHDLRLKHWYGASRIVSQENYEEACRWALGKILGSEFVSIDIETSTPAESDDWMEERKRGNGGEDTGLALDVLGSELTGCGFTFGDNQQYSLYFTVDHVEEPGITNVTSEQVRKFVELVPTSKPLVVQNASFELTVLHQCWGEAWKDNGWEGFLPNIHDTKILRSYENENASAGLKQMSEAILGYKQTTYAEVTNNGEFKMNQLTARHVVGYGLDDTICTSAIFTYLRFVLELENTWEVYKEVDIKPAYLNAMRYLRGTPLDLEKVLELERLDKADFDAAWVTLRTYLIAHGWDGTVCPQFATRESYTPAAIKAAYTIVTGEELDTRVRVQEKLFAFMGATENGAELAALMQSACESGDDSKVNAYLKVYFKGEPIFSANSPKQMQRLLYDTMGLPLRLTNKPTDAMRAKGIKVGGARTDHLTIEFALTYDQEKGEEVVKVLKAIQAMKTAQTRQGLFYTPYRNVRHWKDGLIHAQYNQCAARTRRYSAADPNTTQLPKHPKQGKPARFREVYVPHKKNAVIVSMDFKAQELILIADRSQDPNMLACFVGANKKDMHSITGVGIMVKKPAHDLWTMSGKNDAGLGMAVMMASGAFQEASTRWRGYSYETFAAALEDKNHPDAQLLKLIRALGKKTNFTTEYGAQAPKLAETLIVTRQEAQSYIDAKYEAFARAEAWKKEEIALAHQRGYSETLMGARRHLPDLRSSNKFDVLSAERQGVNYIIQGSGAEQAKLTEGRLWAARVFYKYDANYIGLVHDELVMSVAVEDLLPFVREVHTLMTMAYSTMKVPVISSISLGRNFGEQIEVGDDFYEDRIVEAVRSLGHELVVA